MINSSVWTKINPDVEILDTKKKFYNKYLFKIEYCVEGASILTYSSAKNIETIKKSVRIYNSTKYRYLNHTRKKGNADVGTLIDFFSFKENIDKSIAKIRIERSSFCIYSDDHQYLLDQAQTLLSKHAGLLKYVHLVKSYNEQVLLEQGYIIVKKPKSYPYRVRLNYCSYKNFDNRESLVRYIEQLGDDVKISKNLLEELRTSNKYFHGGHLYLRDPNVANMLKFISPTVVGKTHQMIQG